MSLPPLAESQLSATEAWTQRPGIPQVAQDAILIPWLVFVSGGSQLQDDPSYAPSAVFLSHVPRVTKLFFPCLFRVPLP